jgi:chitinase
MTRFAIAVIFIFLICARGIAQENRHDDKLSVIGYYAGRPTMIDSFEIEKLTHLIFSFCHLKGNQLAVSNARDSAAIQCMISLKQRNPSLKVMLSLGGWSGCATCSPVFATRKGRKAFALSVKQLIGYFGADGIDLDWEYPAIEGFPGHPYSQDDKAHFTALVRTLRRTLGRRQEISFAAGGFSKFIDSSIEWKKVMPKVNRVNLMSYDLVSGFSGNSGHHTPLYSTPHQTESTDHAVELLLAAGVPSRKIAIGAAFYGRLFAVTDSTGNGLYQPGHFVHGLSYRYLADSINAANGYKLYRDSIAQAPYAFNPQRMLLATYDDSVSVRLKTIYAIRKKLNGIMFWQLADDRFSNGLLEVIDETKKTPVKENN